MNIRLLYRKVHFIAFIILLIFCFGIFYSISVKNNLNSIDSSINRIEAKKKILELYSDKIQLEGEIAILSAMFPEKLDARWVMSVLNKIAKKENVDIVTIRPLPIVSGEFHDELRISVLMKGSYHQLGRMIAAIDSADKYIQIENLKASSTSKANSKIKTEDGNITLEWQINVLSIAPKI